MSQDLVRQLLLELGGRATTKQIAELARERYPKTTLHTYVFDRLRKMERWGDVSKEGEYWVITRAGK